MASICKQFFRIWILFTFFDILSFHVTPLSLVSKADLLTENSSQVWFIRWRRGFQLLPFTRLAGANLNNVNTLLCYLESQTQAAHNKEWKWRVHLNVASRQTGIASKFRCVCVTIIRVLGVFEVFPGNLSSVWTHNTAKPTCKQRRRAGERVCMCVALLPFFDCEFSSPHGRERGEACGICLAWFARAGQSSPIGLVNN